MITELTTPFVERKDEFITWLKSQESPDYVDLLRQALEIASRDLEWNSPDPERIHTIDDGDYQGTLVFIIACKGYQPSLYWATSVSYGSCSGCDALQDAWGYGDEHNYEDMYLLALHMMQRLQVITSW